MDPFFIAETTKSFEQASTDLQEALVAQDFGVLAVHDLGQTLRSKGIEFTEDCRIYDICNPGQAARVLKTHMTLSMALPCRISVFTEGRQTRIGMIRPEGMLQSLSSDPDVVEVAQEVESATKAIIKAAAS
jgi:uncharacterized protein (DUF302 family)